MQQDDGSKKEEEVQQHIQGVSERRSLELTYKLSHMRGTLENVVLILSDVPCRETMLQ